MPPTEEECVGTPSHNTGLRACGKVVKEFCRQYRRVGIRTKQLQYCIKYCDVTINAVPTSQPEVLGGPIGPHPSVWPGRCFAIC